MKGKKFTIWKYKPRICILDGKEFPIIAMIMKPGHKKNISICTLFEPFNIIRNANISDCNLVELKTEDRDRFFHRTIDLIDVLFEQLKEFNKK